MWGGEQSVSDEVCLIDSGIQSLRTVPLHQNLQVLNLHCNQIKKIENLEGLQHLSHLDLSSNQIPEIRGLEFLVHLRTLNLSCNCILTVQGLENLRSLVKLNLSYNQIGNISGLQSIEGAEYQLTQLELHGNSLVSIDHVSRCLVGASKLMRLVLEQSGADNPCCRQQGYRSKLLSQLPRLQTLDGLDRHGNPCADLDMGNLPGLEQYTEFLASSDSDMHMVGVVTPKIDAAMEAFRHRGASTSDVTSGASELDISHQSAAPTHHAKKTAGKSHPPSEHLARLEKLENQMINLLYSSKESSTPERDTSTSSPGIRPVRKYSDKRTAKRDIDDTDESADESSSSTRLYPDRKSTSQTGTKVTRSPQSKARGSKVTRSSRQSDPKKQIATKRNSEKLVVRGRSVSPPSQRHEGRRPANRTTQPLATDEQMRDSLHDTYVQIMRELETERERRWKAEEASKKLVEHIKHLQTRAKEDCSLQDVAGQVTTRLKQAITHERESVIRLRDQVDLLKEELEETNSKLENVTKSEEETRSALKVSHETAVNTEKEQLRKQVHEAKRLQEATLKAAASTREVEILQNNVKTLKGQLQQMQELLANREHDHRKELHERYAMDSPQLQDVIQKELLRQEQSHAKNTEHLNYRLTQLNKEYESLEDEFRMGLQIETNRFQQLQEAYEATSKESAHNKQALLAAQGKDEKSAAIISEITSLVKEQKGRITELSKAKQEQHHEFKERVQALESHLEEARRRMVSMEYMKQEKMKLNGQLDAQLSLVEGLKAEKKIWGEELAQQESGLAQDRGRMEAKIEALKSEVGTLKKHLDHETDSVRIKAKIVDDQTETIRKLKDGLQERDVEVRKAREEILKIQRDLEQQLSAELIANHELQEKLDRARDRKEQLKADMNEMEDKLEQSKSSHDMLARKWKEKSTLIGQLEQQVLGMKESWDSKERKLTEERDKAVHAASLTIERLRSMDDTFRRQLDQKEESHQVAMETLDQDKQEEIDTANKRVIEVEEEMRILLRENETNKRAMEERVKKLTQAFTELQHDLY